MSRLVALAASPLVQTRPRLFSKILSSSPSSIVGMLISMANNLRVVHNLFTLVLSTYADAFFRGPGVGSALKLS